MVHCRHVVVEISQPYLRVCHALVGFVYGKQPRLVQAQSFPPSPLYEVPRPPFLPGGLLCEDEKATRNVLCHFEFAKSDEMTKAKRSRLLAAETGCFRLGRHTSCAHFTSRDDLVALPLSLVPLDT